MGYTQAAHLLGNKEELAAIAQKLFDPVSRAALAGAVMLGDGLLQLFLMLFVIFLLLSRRRSPFLKNLWHS